jgi:hypothetical protein
MRGRGASWRGELEGLPSHRLACEKFFSEFPIRFEDKLNGLMGRS